MFLNQVSAGLVDYQMLTTPNFVTPFTVSRTNDGLVELADIEARVVVQFTKLEWDVFVTGVTLDGEFTLDWLNYATARS